LKGKQTNSTAGRHVGSTFQPSWDGKATTARSADTCTQESWEVISTEMANQQGPEAVLKYYQKIAEEQNIDLSKPANVVVARDTRASGSRLLGCLLDGLKSAGAEYKDYGFLTTPQLHYMVRCLNTEGTPEAYGTPTEVGYYEKFSSAFKKAMGSKKVSGSLTVDCANGVGGPKLNELIKYLPSKETGLQIHVVNDNVIKPEALNVDVGPPKPSLLFIT
jgi:phosphoacetylglucosamine mutase